jgi:hypothetical protein
MVHPLILAVDFIGGAINGKKVALPTPLPSTVRVPVAETFLLQYTFAWGPCACGCGCVEPVYVWLDKNPAMTIPPQAEGYKKLLDDMHGGLEPPKFDHWNKDQLEQEN